MDAILRLGSQRLVSRIGRDAQIRQYNRAKESLLI